MKTLFTFAFRVGFLGVIIVFSSMSGSASVTSMINQIPSCNASNVITTTGWGTAKSGPQVTIDYGTVDNNGKFTSKLTAPYDAKVSVGQLPPYNFDAGPKTYPGDKSTTYGVESKLWEMQMGPKKNTATNLSTVTTNP